MSNVDRRQDVLDRLFAILVGVLDADSVFHNRGNLPVDKRPAIVLLDGVEAVPDHLRNPTRSRVVQSPVMLTLRPQIFYLAVPNPPKNDGVGEELNAARAAIIKAICQDAQLVDLIGGPRGNGRVSYRGCDTDMQTGTLLEGELQLHFEIDYDLHPSQL